MKRALTVTICAGAALDMMFFLLAFKPNVLWQMLSILLLLASIILLAADLLFITSRRRWYGSRALIPFCITSFCLAMVLPSIVAGNSLRDRVFRSRLPQYEAVLGMMMDGSIDVREELCRIELPPEYSDLAAATLAHKDSNGILTAEFIIGGGFPVKHSGYLFRSEGELRDWEHAHRWSSWFKLDENWYRVSH